MILAGSALKKLREIEPDSIQTCITSPPYYNLRDYETGAWQGGDPDCKHLKRDKNRGVGLEELGRKYHGGGHKHKNVRDLAFGDVCRRCGALRLDEQLGLEDSPELYVEKLVEVLMEVRRVLTPTGTLWLNLGDTYADRANIRSDGESFRQDRADVVPAKHNTIGQGRKAKDLIGVPWLVAFALRNAGWWLRSEIIWDKPNAMPESVEDRPTAAHEKLFLLAKSDRYFYDHLAIRERDSGQDHARTVLEGQPSLHPPGPNGAHRGLRTVNGRDGMGRNKRTVWRIGTSGYREAHFAVFPTRLVEPCILAGSAPGDTVLDPFAGSGTVGVVCGWYGREFLGIELNPEFAQMARRRITIEGRLGSTHVDDQPIDGQLALELT